MTVPIAGLIGAAAIGAGSNLLGGMIEADQNRKLTHEQMDMQREFAQHGIQWKVQDAKAAGLHPLAALGAQTTSFSPMSVMSSDYGLRAAGQSLKDIPLAKYQAQLLDEQLRGLRLENDLKEKDLLGMGQNSGSRGAAGLPLSGVDQGFVVEPNRVKASNTIGSSAGANPYFDRYLDEAGFLRYVPNEQVTDLISDSMPYAFLFWSQEFGKYLAGVRGKQRPDFDAPEGHTWVFHKGLNMWQAVPSPSFYRGNVPSYGGKVEAYIPERRK